MYYVPVELSFALIRENKLEMLVPNAVVATMIATAISPAIKPYSIAVAPVSSLTKPLTEDFAECIKELKDIVNLYEVVHRLITTSTLLGCSGDDVFLKCFLMTILKMNRQRF